MRFYNMTTDSEMTLDDVKAGLIEFGDCQEIGFLPAFYGFIMDVLNGRTDFKIHGMTKEEIFRFVIRLRDRINYAIVITYGKAKTMERDKAIQFYSQAVSACDGSEKERYSNVLASLLSGKKVCCDE